MRVPGDGPRPGRVFVECCTPGTSRRPAVVRKSAVHVPSHALRPFVSFDVRGANRLRRSANGAAKRFAGAPNPAHSAFANNDALPAVGEEKHTGACTHSYLKMLCHRTTGSWQGQVEGRYPALWGPCGRVASRAAGPVSLVEIQVTLVQRGRGWPRPEPTDGSTLRFCGA